MTPPTPLVNGYIRFVAFDEEDDSEIGEITDATDKSVLVELDGPGGLEFTLNRISDQRQDCRPGRFIRVYLTDTIDETITSDPIAGYIVSESDNALVQEQEYGAEDYRRSAEGFITVLSDAIAWHESVTSTDAAAPTTEDDAWHWTAAMGAYMPGIVVRMLEEAQERGCFPFVTWDFTRTADSDGTPWSSDVAITDYKLNIGTDLLSLLGDAQGLGLVFQMSPDWVLSCRERANFGSDLSGSVSFERGDNLSAGAVQKQIAAPARSSVLVKGTRGDNGETTWVEADSAAGLDEVKRRKEGFLDAGSTTGFTTLTNLGLESIYQKLRLRLGPSALPVLDSTLRPFTDYQQGDTVTVDVPGAWNSEARQITGVQLTDRETGDYDVLLVFDAGPSYQSKGSTVVPVGITECCPPDGPFIPPEDASVALDVVLSVGSAMYGGGDRNNHYATQVGATMPTLVNGRQYRLVATQLSDFSQPINGYEFMTGVRISIEKGLEGIDGVAGYWLDPSDMSSDNPYPWTVDSPYMPGDVTESPWRIWDAADVEVDPRIGATMISGFYGGFWQVRLQLQQREGDGSAIVEPGSGPTAPNYGQPVIEQATDAPVADVYTTNYPYIPGSLRVYVSGVLVNVIETDPATGEWAFVDGFDPGLATIGTDYQAGSSTATGGTNAQPTPGTSLIPDSLLPLALGDFGWFDVTDYGAVGDGVTDDASAINDAITALNAAGGGVLYLPHASDAYRITSALTSITVACVVRGDGAAAFPYATGTGSRIEQASDTANVFTFTDPGWVIEDLAIINTEGNPSAGAGIVASTTGPLYARMNRIQVGGFYDCVDLSGNGRWTLTDSYIYDPVRYGIRIRGDDDGDHSISGCYIMSDVHDGTAAIRQEGAGGLKVVNTKINERGVSGGEFVDGISVSIGAGITTSVLLVANTSIENVTGDGIDIATVSTGFFGLVTIVGCEILATGNTGRAVKIAAATNGELPDAGAISGVVIASNVFRTDGTPRAAIELTNTDRVTMSANVYIGFDDLYTASGDTNTEVTGGASFATPSIVLGSSAAGGAASTVIRSDATIAAFDATSPTTQAFGDSAATGSVAFAARRDHKHGMPSAPAPPAVLLVSGHAVPFTFDEILQESDGSDFLHASA